MCLFILGSPIEIVKKKQKKTQYILWSQPHAGKRTENPQLIFWLTSDSIWQAPKNLQEENKKMQKLTGAWWDGEMARAGRSNEIWQIYEI